MSKNTNEYRNNVRAFLLDSISGVSATIDDDTPLFSSGLLDSLDIVRLAVFLESQYGIRVSPFEIGLDGFDSIARIVRFIEARRG